MGCTLMCQSRSLVSLASSSYIKGIREAHHEIFSILLVRIAPYDAINYDVGTNAVSERCWPTDQNASDMYYPLQNQHL